MRIAITRAVPESLARCELTHLARTPIDVARANDQHRRYEAALAALGCTIRSAPAADDLPDSVFVEDVAVVLDELAIVTRPGAPSRRGERDAVAALLSEYRPLHAIAAPGTVDGGDVLVLGRTLYVGLSTRTNEDAAHQLARMVEPFGYEVRTVQVAGCLHLKSAATALDAEHVLCNPAWIDPRTFDGYRTRVVHPDEPHAANVLNVGGTVVAAAAHVRTIAALQADGYRVCAVDVSELAKAEGAVTCCSVIVEASGSRLPASGSDTEAESQSWKLEAGSWELEAGSWELEAGSWKLGAGNKMPAYVLAIVDIKEPVKYESYRQMVLPTITAFGGRFIARGGKTDVLEGAWAPRRVVIVEFPSYERAKAWWSSPEYAEAKAIRQATSEGTLIVIEGV
jgi:dimethylargininase